MHFSQIVAVIIRITTVRNFMRGNEVEDCIACAREKNKSHKILHCTPLHKTFFKKFSVGSFFV